ncbi:molybdopterin molybdotransferase MoeA [Sphingomonas immobilis]|uniref:Molybdopterin molybdenumtransferase n=1 Tax=Sphingomonas immobilis TaxID=3063997 RepID=A0ABT8ZZ89_9SPHN|nr:molybdopterin molybdotransferase MoeA [Sphingomonas sp. CA1-15]MDO7842892.1 molybdopterin molybdotransferase MoeA [Sphingomonas sp. CA1-15]
MANLAFSLTPVCHAALDFDAALALMEKTATPIGIERIPLAVAAGRVLAEPVVAMYEAPPVDVSAMDGYAVCAPDSPGAAGTLQVVGQSFPGNPCDRAVGTGQAVRIFTGAPMPAGADRVVVQEDVARHDDTIVCAALPHVGRHVRCRGSDFAAGDILLSAGRLLDPRAMVAAAAAGVGHVVVARRPRVTIIASGDELSAPGTTTNLVHNIPDSVSLAVGAMASAWGGDIVSMAIVPDRPEAIRQRLGEAIAVSDVVVIVGGASTGDRDFSRDVAWSLGISQTFAKVAMKPGKPVWHGHSSGGHVLGLPGNPTAALTTARLFLAPLLCLLTGRAMRDALRWRTAPLRAPAQNNDDARETFLCGDWDGESVRLIERQSASAQARLAEANVIVRSAASAPAAPEGAPVTILDF